MRSAVIAFASAHFKETRSKAWAVVLIYCRELPVSNANSERALLDWLSTPHADAELDRACKQALKHIGT